ncbi:hypothetical protein KUCAC02_025139 [Chaenocephalus aceratus]|nr:hypothetical protein KUCAC02_025139 [Chaenocephalus aceratus]
MCSRCSSECQKQGAPCSKCSGGLDRCSRREVCVLWGEPGGPCVGTERACDEEKLADYKDAIRARVFDRVSQSRHLSASALRTLFHECFAPQVCTCNPESEPNPMCASCTPVLTVMQLLAKHPAPLVSSVSERAIPGRYLARNVYDRALLTKMLNDRDMPLCANGRLCKGMLVRAENDPGPLPSLISPESYKGFVSSRARETGEVEHIHRSCCILCLLFNQSAAVAQMLSPDALRHEPHPSEPVYYFNVKLSPDLGVPEASMDEYQGYLVNFQGSVGSYKPTYYYNWRDMLRSLGRDEVGRINFLTFTRMMCSAACSLGARVTGPMIRAK